MSELLIFRERAAHERAAHEQAAHEQAAHERGLLMSGGCSVLTWESLAFGIPASSQD